MDSKNLLQQLRHLDKFSSEFHDQLCNILYGEGYQQSVPNLRGNDLAGLIDYLDEVRCRVTLSRLCLSQHRLCIFSTLQIPVSGSVYANSEYYVALG